MIVLPRPMSSPKQQPSPRDVVRASRLSPRRWSSRRVAAGAAGCSTGAWPSGSASRSRSVSSHLWPGRRPRRPSTSAEPVRAAPSASTGVIRRPHARGRQGEYGGRAPERGRRVAMGAGTRASEERQGVAHRQPDGGHAHRGDRRAVGRGRGQRLRDPCGDDGWLGVVGPPEEGAARARRFTGHEHGAATGQVRDLGRCRPRNRLHSDAALLKFDYPVGVAEGTAPRATTVSPPPDLAHGLQGVSSTPHRRGADPRADTGDGWMAPTARRSVRFLRSALAERAGARTCPRPQP